MGYTHYWTPVVHSPKEKKKRFDKFFAVCKKLYENLPEHSESAGGYYKEQPIKIAGGLGEDRPLIGEYLTEHEQIVVGGHIEWKTINHGRCVWFNGTDEDGMSHETFAIYEDEASWSFCKTARKPYDLLVCACLIAAGKILGYKINTDGDLADWKPAFDFYAKVTNVKKVVKSKSKFLNKKLVKVKPK